MAVIGKPVREWELPAPQDIPHEKDLPFEVDSPSKSEPIPAEKVPAKV